MKALFSAVLLIWGLPVILVLLAASFALLSSRFRSALGRELLGDRARVIEKEAPGGERPMS